MLLIYSPVVSPRMEYIFDAIFGQEYGLQFNITNDVTLFKSHEDEKLNYSGSRLDDEFFIKASTLLSENFIIRQDIIIEEKNGTKVLFSTDESCNLGFDIFSAAFYMLSRYEEYLPFIADQYGRFKKEDSLAYKNNFLQIPVVDKWLDTFKEILQNKFPSLKFKRTGFNAIITYDIDVAYKFKGRNFIRNFGSTIKDFLGLNFKNILNRAKVLTNNRKDPWDSYDYLHDIISQNDLQSIFFFLMGNSSVHDRNLHYKNDVMKELVHKIKSFSEIGIHPSFQSSEIIEKIRIEKQRLESISNKKITKSRQHFLKFTLPETFQALINAGIAEDYSMGFPYGAGFRAGTSKPFYFYNLKNETPTRLKLFPVTFMEGNFMNNRNLSKEKVLESIDHLINEVKKVNGTFISIWHNHTVSNTSEYKDWRFIHDKMIQKLSALNNMESLG